MVHNNLVQCGIHQTCLATSLLFIGTFTQFLHAKRDLHSKREAWSTTTLFSVAFTKHSSLQVCCSLGHSPNFSLRNENCIASVKHGPLQLCYSMEHPPQPLHVKQGVYGKHEAWSTTTLLFNGTSTQPLHVKREVYGKHEAWPTTTLLLELLCNVTFPQPLAVNRQVYS